MAEFRKLFLVLAVMALAASAFAQQGTFVCVGNPAAPASLRGGGLTEEVGDVVLTCSNGPVGGQVSGSFQVLMPGSAVTNRIGALIAGQGYPAVGAALTVEVTPVGGSTVYTQVVQGLLQPTVPTDVPASRNLLLFPNVAIPTGTASTVQVRISGIRVSAPVVTSTASATSVFEIVSTSPAQNIPLTNATQQVGLVLPGLQFGLTSCSGGAAPSLTFQQCVDLNIDGGDPNSSLTFGVRFTEGFPTAFKVINGQDTGALGNGEFTGRIFSAAAVTVEDVPDTQDSATRLIFTLSDVPAGVNIRVTDREIAGANASRGATATLVEDANSSGVGGSLIDLSAGTDEFFCGTSITPVQGRGHDTAAPLTNVQLVDAQSSGSTVYAVWEVTGQTLDLDSLVFGVQVSFVADPGAGSPALTGPTPATPAGNFAPQSTINYGHRTAQIPRFNTQALTSEPLLAIVPCVTNLLFPYITSTQGFDTGLALVNTSLDNATGADDPQPFNTSAQTGPCTLYFFGNMTIAPQTTEAVDPGTLIKFTMNQPPAGWDNTAGFEGYIIARCNFQYAHGLAFIVDTRVPGFGSQAYLALVIPDRAGARPPKPFTEDSGAGEQLVH